MDSRLHEATLTRLRVTPPVAMGADDDLHYRSNAEGTAVVMIRRRAGGAEYWEPFNLPPGRWMLVRDDGHSHASEQMAGG